MYDAVRSDTANVKNPLNKQLAIFACCLLILFLRRPSTLTRPQFWAEDATVFFHDQLLLGFAALWHPYAGYLHSTPRLIAALAGLLPARWAPLCYSLAALVVAALCCSEFARPKYRVFLANDMLRVSLVIVMAAAFPCYELIGNVANLQWFMLVAFIPMALEPETFPNYLSQAAHFALGLLAGVTVPALVILMPLLFLKRGRGRFAPLPVGLTAGLAAQFFVFVRGSAANSAHSWEMFVSVIRTTLVALSNQVILPSLLGQRHAFSLATKGPHYAGPLVLLLFFGFSAALYSALSSVNRSKLLAALWFILSSLMLSMATRESVRDLLPSFSHAIRFGADRYFFCACCLFVYCLALAAERWGGQWLASPRRAAAFALLFVLSITVNFKIGPLSDLHWATYAPQIDEWARCYRMGTPHPPVSVPVSPSPWRIDLPAIR